LMPEVEANNTSASFLTKKLRSVNCLVPWETYLERQLAQKKDVTTIAAQWRGLLSDPSVHRELIVVNGKKVVGVEFFDRVEKISDVGETEGWEVNKKQKLQGADELTAAIAVQLAEFEERRESLGMSVSPAVPAMPAPSVLVSDHEVPRHQQPVPTPASLAINGPTVDRPMTHGLLRSMLRAEKQEAEAADELEHEMAGFASETAAASRKEKSQEAAKLTNNSKALIAARAVLANQEVQVNSKRDSLLTELGVTKDTVEHSNHQKKKDWIKTLEAQRQAANDAADACLEELQTAGEPILLGDETISVQTIKDSKAACRAVMTKFVAEGSKFKKAKYEVDTISKAITAFTRKVVKSEKSKAATALESRGQDVLVSNPMATASLAVTKFSSVLNMKGALHQPIPAEWIEPFAVHSEEVLSLVERYKASSWMKAQKSFLTNWLAKNESHQFQEAQVSVKLIVGQVSDALEKAFEGTQSENLALMAEGQLKDNIKTWGKAFHPHIGMACNNCSCGLALYGLGEVLIPCEGDVKVLLWPVHSETLLSSQIMAIKAMPKEQMEASAKFIWSFDSEAGKGQGQVLVIPSGFISVRTSKSFVSIAQHFCGVPRSLELCSKALGKLFESFPATNSGAYRSFAETVVAKQEAASAATAKGKGKGLEASST
jgi:hypothetical protein